MCQCVFHIKLLSLLFLVFCLFLGLQLLHSVLSVESMVDADDVTNDLGSRHYDAKVTTTSRAWKDIFLSYATVDEAVDSGRLKLDKSLSSLKQLMACLEH